MARWSDLSREIRDSIWDILLEDYRFDQLNPYTRAGYARVSRQWQPVFERRNFQRLVVDQDALRDLGKILTEERQLYLEHLFLRVRLEEYDCDVCQTEENEETSERNSDVFSVAVWQLLSVLNKWTGFGQIPGRSGRRQQGLTLEFGAYSPSDCKHIFQDFRLEPDYPYHEVPDLETYFKSYQQRRERLGIEHMTRQSHPGAQGSVSVESRKRVLGNPLIVRELLPRVNIVTGLLIRRQFYRKIQPGSLGALLKSFPCLSWFRHEGWRHIDLDQRQAFEMEYVESILSNLPSTLRDLYIFEDSNQVLHPVHFGNRSRQSFYGSDRALGESLAQRSRSLENLSAAFLVDATSFFRGFFPSSLPCPNTIPWSNLQTLALTSSILGVLPCGDCGMCGPCMLRSWQREELIKAAVRAAKFMPQLEIMELWNCRNNLGSRSYRFCYIHDSSDDDPGQPVANYLARESGTWVNAVGEPAPNLSNIRGRPANRDIWDGPSIFTNLHLSAGMSLRWFNLPKNLEKLRQQNAKGIQRKNGRIERFTKVFRLNRSTFFPGKLTHLMIPNLRLRNNVLDVMSQFEIQREVECADVSEAERMGQIYGLM